jgi:hypothetical protein
LFFFLKAALDNQFNDWMQQGKSEEFDLNSRLSIARSQTNEQALSMAPSFKWLADVLQNGQSLGWAGSSTECLLDGDEC